MSSSNCPSSELQARLVRYDDLIPCRSAFIDTRTPGSDHKENFTIIGHGVAENPEQHVHIDIPHGFNIGAARQPPGCVNSQHSHETAEVFVVHAGQWAFHFGANADGASVELGPGDIISIPVGVFRGFSNIGKDIGFLFAVLGGDDPGRVTWAPYVFESAREHGLVLLKSGRLIDTTRGETVPDGEAVMPPTTQEDAEKLRKMNAEEAARCVIREPELTTFERQPFDDNVRVFEAPLIGPACSEDGVPAGRMDWNHGFHVRRQRLEPGAQTPAFIRDEPEVLMMQSGKLELVCNDEQILLTQGDVMTVPVGTPRRYRNNAEDDAVVYVVRGGDRPGGFRLVDLAS
ncbi:MAG: cupin domain-containing protein [Woeseia sp.]